MKNILLTGAARGLGLAIAERLAASGEYRVIGIGRTLSDEYLSLMDSNASLSFYSFDLNDLDEISGLVSSITSDYGALYGVVNNAGIGLDGVLATQHNSEISRVLRVNLEAAILMTKYGCRSMLRHRTGRIVNISSIIASTGFSGLAAYAASKAGLEGFTRSLSRELGRARITVNCVAPGYMETDMTTGLDDAKMASIRRRAPLGLPLVEDAAGAVAYLLSEDAARVTGTILTVDGGSTA
ncbi:3-oxoacyl-ACP reductase [Maricaulis sp. W15]|uniref:3-oxoacyl-[acyl-carrier protein] reductase n=1 Tax=Maricaulis maris TaxID=74318 RepID=A0A495CY43_9PROT|nr:MULTISPECIES: SDR family NAD(P)-dependent oxidoreductase [Maricaulis]OLF78251.1 3-oxoacyl-ACP reductase [Maricaulis sp. W15]RKQ94113.1 3-oxoacyl-[acyl-carrier protein] reductase [Maricaulis maris]